MTRRSSALIALLAVLLAAVPAPAQEKKETEGDKQIAKFLAAETDRVSKKELDGATTLAEWEKKLPRLKQEYLYMLGLWPLPEKTPLKATVTGQIEHEGVVIEKLHYQSKPGLYVTANLYRPKEVKGKLPAILYVCGHSNRGRDGNKTAFQDHGLWFANNGYVCLMVDTLQLGEIPGVHHGTYGRPYNHLKAYGIKDKDKGETRWWWHARGYTPAGVECWNGVRGIDYLVTLPEVDPDRIGVTGISGGGAATFWVAAADERVKVAVPVSGMSDLESYVKDRVINGHCDCMFLYNTFQWEWTTIAALVAPRPMLFANSDNDPIFPMDGNRRIIERLRKLYKMYGKPDLVDEYVSKGGHDYRPDLRVAIFKFINKHLKNDATAPVEDSAKFKPLPGKELRVFPTDEDIPKDAINAKIDETFVPAAKVNLPQAGQYEEWRQDLLKKLRASSFRPFPKEIPAAKRGRNGAGPHAASLFTEPGIETVLLEGGGEVAKDGFATLLVVDQSALEKHDASILLKGLGEAGYSPYVLLLRGQGEQAWTRKSPPNFVERSHVLLGWTVDEGRVYDIIAAVRYLRAGSPKRDVRLMGGGEAGILAAYAALFEPAVKELHIILPPKTHAEGPSFLNVLRVLDIPEALGMLAPRRLTLVNARDPAFDRTAEIYRLAGAADKLTRK